MVGGGGGGRETVVVMVVGGCCVVARCVNLWFRIEVIVCVCVCVRLCKKQAEKNGFFVLEWGELRGGITREMGVGGGIKAGGKYYKEFCGKAIS